MQTWPDGGAGGREAPTPEQMATWRRRSGPPDNELPAVVGVTAVLGRADDAVVGLAGLQVFSTGLVLMLAVRLRVDPPRDQVNRLTRLLASFPGEPADAERRLLLGIEYADGRVASNLGGAGWPFDERDDEPVLRAGEGSGSGGRRYDQRFFLSPLPPPGRLLVVCSCSGLGIEETTTELDGRALVQAAGHVQVLWEPAPEPGLPPPRGRRQHRRLAGSPGRSCDGDPLGDLPRRSHAHEVGAPPARRARASADSSTALPMMLPGA